MLGSPGEDGETRQVCKRQPLGLGSWRAFMRPVHPVFYSYLGFGLKAARLATLGALEMEGSSGDMRRVGVTPLFSLPLPSLGSNFMAEKLILE